MIDLIDGVLRQVLFEELSAAGMPLSSVDRITFLSTDAAPIGSRDDPTVNLYLHDIRENLALRADSLQVSRKPDSMEAQIRRRGVRLDIGYVVTCSAGGEPQIEHRLLADVMSAYMRRAQVPSKYLTQEFIDGGGESVFLAVAQPDHGANSDLRGVLASLGVASRPAFGLVVTSSFNPFETRVTKLVREAVAGISTGIQVDDRPVEVLRRRVSAAGIVEDSAGSALFSVDVRTSDARHSAQTNADGVFFMADLPVGPCTLEFVKPGFETTALEVECPPVGRPDLLSPVRVVLKRSLSPDESEQGSSRPLALDLSVVVTGRLEYPDGRPGAFLIVSSGKSTSVSDANGKYEIECAPQDAPRITVETPGFGHLEIKSGAVGILEPQEVSQSSGPSSKSQKKGGSQS